MEKKTIAIIAVVVIAILVIVGVGIGMSSNNSDTGAKYVTYDGNGGYISPSGSTVIKEYNETAPYYGWIWGYHTFKYYTENKDGTGAKYYVGDHVSYGKTLYAQYDYDDKTKIVINGTPAGYFTIKQGTTDITGTTTVTNDPTKEFKIDINAGTNVTFDDEVSSDTITVFENTTPVKIITIQYEKYKSEGISGTGLSKGENQCRISCQHLKTVTLTITDAPPS